MKDKMGAILKVEEAEKDAKRIVEKGAADAKRIVDEATAKEQRMMQELDSKMEQKKREKMEHNARMLAELNEKESKAAHAAAEKVANTKVSQQTLERIAKKAADIILGA